MGGSELPPCCRGCELYEVEAGHCSLLAYPSLENRRQLLSMPCNVQEIVARRFRSQGPDAAREALTSWLDPDWDELALRGSYGDTPLDARLWLSAWPFLYLGRNAVRQAWRNAREQPWSELPGPPDAESEDPTRPGRILRALEGVRLVDPVGYAMLVEGMRGEFAVSTWKHELGVSDATVADRRHLALYRYLVLVFDVLSQLDPKGRAALRVRCFSPGDPSDGEALMEVRSALRKPGLSLSELQKLHRVAAARSLELLAQREALGEAGMERLDGPFRRVLRIEARR